MSATCQDCGRPLLDPESRAAGRGPVCAAKLRPPRGRRTASPDQLTFLEQHPMDQNEQTEQTAAVLAEVAAERVRQDAKWGEQNHPHVSALDAGMATELAREFREVNATDDRSWHTILLEEAYEAGAETDPVRIRAELIQVAATAVVQIEAIDRALADQEHGDIDDVMSGSERYEQDRADEFAHDAADDAANADDAGR
ncbi:DUF6011 domain-containing protein [Streptomyces chryseus]